MRERLKSFPWKPIGEWAMKGGLVLWGLVAPVVVTLIISHVMRPTVHLKFESSYPMVILPERRPASGDESFAIKVITDIALKDAEVRLLAISENEDLSEPLNGFVEANFGWPQGPESFQPRRIAQYDYIVIATEKTLPDGTKHIQLFLDRFNTAVTNKVPLPELEFLKDLKPGTYFLEIALVSETDPISHIAKIKLTWDGKTELKMSVL